MSNDVKVTWDDLIQKLRARLERLGDYNLVLVALPLESAHEDAPRLSEALAAHYVDFDRELIGRLESDGWDDHVSLAMHGHLEPGRALAEAVLDEVVAALQPARPVVVGNPNLAAFYGLDLGTLLYPRTRAGHCILAAPGHVRGQTLLLQGLHPQTGAGFTPVWELAKS